MAENKISKHDLTQGSILDKLLHISLPIIGTQVIQMTYNLADMFWLGKISSDAVAASGTVGMYMWLSMTFQIIGNRGAEIGVSQSTGRGDTAEAKNYAQTGFTLAAILGAAVAFIYFVFSGPLIGFYNIQETHVALDAQRYLAIVAFGIPFNYLTATITGAYNGSGNSRAPFVINVIALVLNMILDPIFIFVLDFGIRGAAIATVIAQCTAAVLLMILMKKGKSRPFESFTFFERPSPVHTKQIFRWTVPMAVESFLFTFMSMLVSRLVAGWGSSALAAQRVVSQVESVTWLVAGGFSSAFVAFAGQNFGAKRYDRIKKGFKLSSVAMLIYGTAITVLLLTASDFLIGIFLKEGEDGANALNIGITYIRILAAFQILACLEGVAAGAFRGIGKTMYPSVVSVSTNLMRVIAAYILSRTALGLNGIWIAVSAGAGLRGLWMYVWYLIYDKRRTKLEPALD